jgi:hypothetical protein
MLLVKRKHGEARRQTLTPTLSRIQIMKLDCLREQYTKLMMKRLT